MVIFFVKSRKNNIIAANGGGNFIPQQSFGQPVNFGVPNQYNQQPNMYNQNNQYGQNNYYPQYIPQAANINMNANQVNPQNPNDSTFIPGNSFRDSSNQGNNNNSSTFYAEEQKVSLDKKDY